MRVPRVVSRVASFCCKFSTTGIPVYTSGIKVGQGDCIQNEVTLRGEVAPLWSQPACLGWKQHKAGLSIGTWESGLGPRGVPDQPGDPHPHPGKLPHCRHPISAFCSESSARISQVRECRILQSSQTESHFAKYASIWRCRFFIFWTTQHVEPGGLLSMGSHRVGHDWSDLAAAACGIWMPCVFSCSGRSDSLWPHGLRMPGFPISWSLLRPCPLSCWCYLTILSSPAPFSFGWPGVKPGPLLWKLRILTIGPPGTSHINPFRLNFSEQSLKNERVLEVRPIDFQDTKHTGPSAVWSPSPTKNLLLVIAQTSPLGGNSGFLT